MDAPLIIARNGQIKIQHGGRGAGRRIVRFFSHRATVLIGDYQRAAFAILQGELGKKKRRKEAAADESESGLA